jgi:hypothetical protein
MGINEARNLRINKMPIKEFNIVFSGQNESIVPRFGHLHTTNTQAQVVAAGYLNPYMKSQSFSVLPTDFIFVVASDGHQIYKPVFGASGIVTLTVLP